MAQTLAHGLAGDPRRHRREAAVAAVFRGAALTSVAVGALIVAVLAGRAAEFVSQVDPGALWERGWFPRSGQFDLVAILVGTLVIGGIAMAVAAPLGLGAALYLAEFAPSRARRTLKPVLEVLAGIPSVVLGVFALTFISPEVVQRLFPQAGIFNGLAAGIAVGILTVPLVASVAEDALRAVPATLRDASYGLGASRVATAFRVVVPAAASGVVAALVLGLSRALGETMVVAVAAGATGGSLRVFNPLEQMQTMTAAMAALAVGGDRVKGDVSAVDSLYFVGLLLFAMTLALNAGANRVVRRLRRAAR